MSREYPCVYYDNEKCKKFSDDKVTSWCVLGPCGEQRLSNADRIRAMSDEELADALMAYLVDSVENSDLADLRVEFEGGYRDALLRELRQPVKDGDADG